MISYVWRERESKNVETDRPWEDHSVGSTGREGSILKVCRRKMLKITGYCNQIGAEPVKSRQQIPFELIPIALAAENLRVQRQKVSGERIGEFRTF